MQSMQYRGTALPGHRCPRCGSHLLVNALGDVWCSFVKCDYGLGGMEVKLVEGKVVAYYYGAKTTGENHGKP